MMVKFNHVAILLGALLVVTVQSIPTISVTGSKFFTSEGKQFYVKGICISYIRFQHLAH